MAAKRLISILSILAAISTAGCQSAQRIFYRPAAPRVAYQQPTFVLASETGTPIDSASKPLELAQATDSDTNISVPTASDNSEPAAAPASRPTSAPTYTAPGPMYQMISMAGTTVYGSMPQLTGAGKEISESVSLASASVIGRPGLAAAPPTFSGAIIGRPGIQRGPATGLGFGSPTHNIFRASFNPMSGSSGRCSDLARAGFFGGSCTACQQHFQQLRR